jgi:hypothetical protein
MVPIVCVNLSKLNSETTAALVADTIYDSARRGKVSSRMCNFEGDSGGLLDGHLGFHETPVQAQRPNQRYFRSSRFKISQFDNSAEVVSGCPTPAVNLSFRHRNILD